MNGLYRHYLPYSLLATSDFTGVGSEGLGFGDLVCRN